MIGTTSSRDVLEQMGMVQAFSTVIHVPTLSNGAHLMEVFKVLVSLYLSVPAFLPVCLCVRMVQAISTVIRVPTLSNVAHLIIEMFKVLV